VVITVEIYKQIRKMRLDGMSQRQIAAVLRISRNTVKKYWNGDSVPWERNTFSHCMSNEIFIWIGQSSITDTGHTLSRHLLV
jgi:DNA invertase Pin-like site-specific DNA recombinase